MEVKKNPEVDVNRKSGMYFMIGAVVALSVLLLSFEWKVYEKKVAELGKLVLDAEEDELIPITQQELPPPPPPPPQTTIIEIVEDDEEIEEELEIEDTEADEDEVVEIVEVEEEEEVAEEEIFTIVETNPSFPGGEAKMYEFLGKNMKYPPIARDNNIQGRVYVSFVVEKNGAITDVRVLRGIGGGCDEEAIRVVKSMPKWSAGKQRGKPVRVRFNLPIVFKLQ
ncbi:energy transducer TonB [bacterium SCSIO 12643]|nr:energy transducer TonB [bacterium SCSIO 12643]